MDRGSSSTVHSIAAAGILSVLVHATGLAWFSAVASRPLGSTWLSDRNLPPLTIPTDLWLPKPVPPVTPPAAEPEPQPAPEVSTLPQPTPEPKAEPKEVVAGIAKSDAQTEAWKGFADGAPQNAPKFSVDQAALSRAPGAPMSGAAQSAASGEPAPNPAENTPPGVTPADQPPQPAVVAPTSEQPQPAPDQAVPENALPVEAPAAPMESPAPAAPVPEVSAEAPVAESPAAESPDREAVTVEGPTEAPERLTAEEAPPRETRVGDEAPIPPVVKVDPAAQARRLAFLKQPPALTPFAMLMQTVARPAGAPSQVATAPGENQGELSDSESVATSRVETVDTKHLGRPLARQGLEITTVRPRWSHVTALLSAPEPAVVRLSFDRRGVVSNVEFVDNQSTGYPDVDGPLMAALYSWSAKGEEIDKLDPTDPEARVRMTFRIVFGD